MPSLKYMSLGYELLRIQIGL